MASEIQTVRVVSADEASQGPFVVINADDFDPAVHQPYQWGAPADTSEQAPPDGEADTTSEQAPRRARKAKEA